MFINLSSLTVAYLLKKVLSIQLIHFLIKTKHTYGHSLGGMTYIVDGLAKPVAVVGDAMFAGSMGGGMISYSGCIANKSRKIMSLSDDTILCPGHGPITSVGEEKMNNPFFPEFS